MTILKIELEWCRDSKGYDLVDIPKRGKWIIGKGGPPERYNPFEMSDVPLLAFANAHSEEKLRNFALRYGYLTTRGYSAQGEVQPPVTSVRRFHWDSEGAITGIDQNASVQHLEGESVDEFVAVAKLFKRVLALTSGRLSRSLSGEVENLLLNYGSPNDVSFNFNIDPMRRLHPVILPGSLISGLLVQLAQLAGGSSFKTCQLARCGTLFAAGGRSGLRADAKFCSPAHRVEHNSRTRSKTARKPSA
ncbi:hypothetical protein [Bradyrhizobium liaoningense]|uniref:hypothetical protein n=1 Tax=Bradyrhizobium liaoningense TaxID=43992 RepID=UPI001BABD36F|nr:hypothetical protein [Bradyrhizobium liaoningense]MBR0946843.1 hypothetical protein [Bradyrhizobium liaoningense]